MKRFFELYNSDGALVSEKQFNTVEEATESLNKSFPEGLPEGWRLIDLTPKYIEKCKDAIKKVHPNFQRSHIVVDWQNVLHSREDIYTVVPFTYQGKHYLYREHLYEGWVEKQFPVFNGKDLNKMPKIINREPLEVRLARAADPESPAGVLRELSKDPFWYVRDFVARNPNTPRECLEELRKESDFRIREDAEKNLAKRCRSSLEDKIFKAESISTERSNENKDNVHNAEVERV